MIVRVTFDFSPKHHTLKVPLTLADKSGVKMLVVEKYIGYYYYYYYCCCCY